MTDRAKAKGADQSNSRSIRLENTSISSSTARAHPLPAESLQPSSSCVNNKFPLEVRDAETINGLDKRPEVQHLNETEKSLSRSTEGGEQPSETQTAGAAAREGKIFTVPKENLPALKDSLRMLDRMPNSWHMHFPMACSLVDAPW